MRLPTHITFAADAPFLRHGWSAGGITFVQVMALLAPLGATVFIGGNAVWWVLATAMLATLFWELCFALIRKRALSWYGLTTALIVTIMLPESVPLWQVGLGVSFGVVLGELIFGGRGFGFLNAAAVALGFLVFSFPGFQLVGDANIVAIVSVPGALLLLVSGLISGRVIMALLVVTLLFSVVNGEGFVPLTTVSTVFFAMVFLICDPVSSASTNGGRWLYGALVGALIALFDTVSGTGISVTALVFAVLLGAVFAPLLDHIILYAKNRRRRARNV